MPAACPSGDRRQVEVEMRFRLKNGEPFAVKTKWSLGAAARETGEEWGVTPEAYAAKVLALVREVVPG